MNEKLLEATKLLAETVPYNDAQKLVKLISQGVIEDVITKLVVKEGLAVTYEERESGGLFICYQDKYWGT